MLLRHHSTPACYCVIILHRHNVTSSFCNGITLRHHSALACYCVIIFLWTLEYNVARSSLYMGMMRLCHSSTRAWWYVIILHVHNDTVSSFYTSMMVLCHHSTSAWWHYVIILHRHVTTLSFYTGITLRHHFCHGITLRHHSTLACYCIIILRWTMAYNVATPSFCMGMMRLCHHSTQVCC